MLNTLPYEEVKQSTGRQLLPSDWLLVDQARINLFAEATGDYQYIHVDEARAAESELGGYYCSWVAEFVATAGAGG